VVQHCTSLDEAAQALQSSAHAAVLLEMPTPAALAGLLSWPGLSHAVLDAAVVVVSPEPDVHRVVPLLQFGVQDVVPPADPNSLARALRLAIERKRIEMAARKAYATDLATGLPNHMQLLEHMTHLVALRAREPAPMALIVLRIEGLAATEAALGVEAANVLKRKVAVRLRSALRASDVVASLGGDTFAVLLAWIDAPDDGERVARKLAQSLTQPFSVTGRERHIAVRVGLASYPEHGDRAENLLRRALGQASSVATIGRTDYAHAVDRGPSAAANDDE
jgi:diguanylate cyclase (GGDEF)-like protein